MLYAATVVAADLSSLADWLALIGYCLLATLSLIIMEMYTVWAPAAAGARLNALRTWVEQHQEQLIVTLSLLVGLWLTAGVFTNWSPDSACGHFASASRSRDCKSSRHVGCRRPGRCVR